MKSRSDILRYRKYGSIAGQREMRMRVPEDVFEFFDSYTHDAKGRHRRPRGLVLEALVELARQAPEALDAQLQKKR